jgi:hypothetical protein
MRLEPGERVVDVERIMDVEEDAPADVAAEGSEGVEVVDAAEDPGDGQA